MDSERRPPHRRTNAARRVDDFRAVDAYRDSVEAQTHSLRHCQNSRLQRHSALVEAFSPESINPPDLSDLIENCEQAIQQLTAHRVRLAFAEDWVEYYEGLVARLDRRFSRRVDEVREAYIQVGVVPDDELTELDDLGFFAYEAEERWRIALDDVLHWRDVVEALERWEMLTRELELELH